MLYVGLDYSKRFSVATVVDQKGRVIKRGKLANVRAAFEEFFKGLKRGKAVIEAGRNYHVAAGLLEGLVEEIQLAHPLKVRAIAEAKIKTDSIDSETLAQLLRGDLIPRAYFRNKEQRQKQIIVRQRGFWVRQRTRVRNRIHWLIDAQAEEIRCGASKFSDLFGSKGKRWLKEQELPVQGNEILEDLLDSERMYTEKIKHGDSLVREIYESDEDCERIDGIPGFGVFLSVLAKVEIAEIDRFKKASALCSYAGVIPSTYSSGGRTWHGKSVKGGNRHLRWGLVEAAIHCLKQPGELRKFFLRIRRKKGIKIARVATARKLCFILYRLLKEKDCYRTFKKNKQSGLQSAYGVSS
jgi:transposase